MEKKPQKQYKRKTVGVKGVGSFKMPRRAAKESTSYMVYLPDDVRVPARSRIAIPLNFTLDLPLGVEVRIDPLSTYSASGLRGYGQRRVVKSYGLIKLKKWESGNMTFNADVIPTKTDKADASVVEVVIRNNDESFLLRKGTAIALMTFSSTIAPFLVELRDHKDDDEPSEEKGVAI